MEVDFRISNEKSLIVFVPDENHVLLRIMEMEMNSLSEEDEIPNKPKYVFFPFKLLFQN